LLFILFYSGDFWQQEMQVKPDADSSTSEEFRPRELLCTLADAYDKNDVAHGNFQ
jgi:hypothetical protein